MPEVEGGAGITRDEAWKLLTEHIDAENLRKHCLATEAIMRKLAERFGADPEVWGIAGLLHDIDYNETKDDPKKHGLLAEKILREKGVSEEIIEAVKAHNAEELGIERKDPFHIALTAAETITGMIVATALVYPDKKLASVKPKSILKRMKEKDFARAIKRERIRLCENIGIPLNQFAEICLEAMRGIADELGL